MTLVQHLFDSHLGACAIDTSFDRLKARVLST